ncbi:multidrug and toxin extrusion protein 1-like [Pleurodeles waltl]|uniref:multidrug and toxin extrusion protein 1-like n=1 Tax=Pleurodeles waltl TaxID=8319 RepID=UPI003709B261
MGFSFGIGFCSATDTLLSQTFGRKNMKQIGVILQRSLLMLILICFPCWALFINTENILLLIKQDPKVARLTADYILICIPVLLGMFVYQLQASFLQNQEITVPQVFIGITANIINACLHYVFLFVLHLGVQGAALALNVAVISQIITTFFYIWIKDLHVETWEGWSWECLQNWHQVTKLAIPSILAVLFEWSIYDIGIILTGLISVTEQGVQSVILQIVLFLYMDKYFHNNILTLDNILTLKPFIQLLFILKLSLLLNNIIQFLIKNVGTENSSDWTMKDAAGEIAPSLNSGAGGSNPSLMRERVTYLVFGDGSNFDCWDELAAPLE